MPVWKRAILAAMLLGLLLAGCGRAVAQPGELTADSQSYRDNFVFVCPILENEYWESCMEGIRKADEELGVTTQIIGPQTSDNFAEEVVQYMDEAIRQMPEGIIVYAGVEELVPLINLASDMGIPVVTLDTDAPDSDRIAYVGTNLYNFGYQSGQTMVELTGGNAQIGYLCTGFSIQGEALVFNAFQDAIHDYNMTVVAQAEGFSDAERAENAARQMLTQHPEITAVFCSGSYNVTGAARAKEALGREELMLLGFDDTTENLAYVKDGVINALLIQSPYQMGYQSVYCLKEYADTGKLPQTDYDTGSYLVTRQNIDTYISTGVVDSGSGKTVRIGYYSGDTAFQDGYSDEERKTGYAYEYYQEIAICTGWKYEYVYGSRREIMELLLNGEVDIAAGIYQTDLRTEQVLFSDSSMDKQGEECYFAVNAGRQDLLVELNYAMEQIERFNPNFAANLRQKYYSHTMQQQLTERELRWLEQKGVLKIGYVRNNLPLCDMDADGNPTGIIKDIVDFLQDYMQVEIVPVGYESIILLENALSGGEIDVAFPFYSDKWLAESKEYCQTDPIISDRVMIIYRGSYDDEIMSRVAINNAGIGQRYYMETYYADSDVRYYDSREEALTAVEQGTVRCMVGCSTVMQRYLLEHDEYRDLNIAYLDISEDFSMAVRQEDSILAGILTKGIRQMDVTTIAGLLIKYSGVEKEYSFQDFLQKYSIAVILLLVTFVTLLVLVFASYMDKTRAFNREQEITHKELEKALDTAKTASEAKTVFLSTMSHDIRTPMNAIVGMTAIAGNNLEDTGKVRECLDKINLSSHHLLTLINDVLDISKIESGKMVLNVVPFSLADTMKMLAEIVLPQVTERELDFSIHSENLEHDEIFADEVRVNQIFVNILTNAVKYSRNGGRVSVTLREEPLSQPGMVRLVYMVADDGIGMTKEFMTHMYDNFARAKDSRIDKIQGTGLGLSIVKQMVDLMGGSIDCQSEPGKGTTFTIRLELPYVEKDEGTESADEQQEISLDGRHLLVAEDNDLNWEVIKELLALQNITAEHAENGQICVDMVTAAQPGTYDLILMDIQMPVMNGREAAAAIRRSEREDLRELPIIALTADAFAEDIAKCMAAGMNGHASKPVDMNALSLEMKRVLSKSGGG